MMPTTCLNFEFCPQTTVYEAESGIPSQVDSIVSGADVHNTDVDISETCGSAAATPEVIASVEGIADIVIIPKKPKWKKKRRTPNPPPKRFCMIM
jgi:hypothetical protein